MKFTSYKPLTKSTFRQYRERLGFTGDQMARLCGASSGRVIRKWEAGDNEIPEGVSRFVWLLQCQSPADREGTINRLMGED